MCGAVVRCCWLPSNAGRNAGDNARNASENARVRRWSLQAAPVVAPGRTARSGASTTSRLRCQGTRLASADAARCAGELDATERHVSDAGTRYPPSSHALTMTAAVERSTASRLPGVRACSTAKHGDCRDLLGFAWIRRRLPEYAQCPNVPRLGTLGTMTHATQNAQQARRAPTLPNWKRRAQTCPTLSNAGQLCPARPVALPRLRWMRDSLSRAAMHNNSPRYVWRAVVDSPRSAACLLRPPDALRSPYSFELRGSARLTAWRCVSRRQERSVGHSAVGSRSPMQGQHETQNHQPRGSHGEPPGLRTCVRCTRGTLRSAARAHAARSAASMQEGNQP